MSERINDRLMRRIAALHFKRGEVALAKAALVSLIKHGKRESVVASSARFLMENERELNAQEEGQKLSVSGLPVAPSTLQVQIVPVCTDTTTGGR